MATFQKTFINLNKACHYQPSFSSGTSQFLSFQSVRSVSYCNKGLNLRTMSSHDNSRRTASVRFGTGPGHAPQPILSHLPSKIPVYRTQALTTIPKEEIDATDPTQLAKTIFMQGLKNVLPSKLITSKVKLQGTLLTLEDDDKTTVDLSQYNKKYVIGFGKACLPMVETLLPMMNGMIDRCIVSIPAGSRDCRITDVEVYRGAENNIPDECSFIAGQEIVRLVRECTPQDLLIILISGGGSALLSYPIPPISVDENRNLIRNLSRAGCSISELNTVRKRISLVKGGGLVQMCPAKKMISLIISDVTGSPLSTISSGPTVPNLDGPNDAWKIVEKYNLEEDLPQSIYTVLKSPPPPINWEVFKKVTNFIIGDNELALEAASAAACMYGLHPFIVTSQLQGVASEVGSDMASLTESLSYYLNYNPKENDIMTKPHLQAIQNIFKMNKWSMRGIIPEIFGENSRSTKGVCLLFGGETVVKVKGTGTGGRNQELALAAGIRLDMSRNLPWLKDLVAILSAGTDGYDGPTVAAGAVVEGRTINDAQLEGISPVNHLKDNDSYNFFNNLAFGKYHIITGHTETNVMDISIIVILKKDVVNKVTKKSML